MRFLTVEAEFDVPLSPPEPTIHESTSHVYLPINIARSPEVTKVRPRDNEAQPGGAAQSFAVNVYVPISIESPGDVKEAGQDDAREGPSETPAGGATDSVADAVPDTTAENLARTVDAQTGKVSWTCTLCDQRYMYKPKAQIHVARHFTPQCCCYWCGQSFLRAAELQSHALAAHGQQVFVCERCNKAFKLHKTYKHHMQDHDGVYAKVCSICGKGCKTNHYYKLHMSGHRAQTGEEDAHVCPSCGKQFRVKASMRNHLRHTACGESASQPGAEHRERYDCPICCASVHGLNKLNAHLELKHGTAVVYRCRYCHQDFARKMVLASHETWCAKQRRAARVATDAAPDKQ